SDNVGVIRSEKRRVLKPFYKVRSRRGHMIDFYKHGPFPTSIEGTRAVVQPQYDHIVEKMKGVWNP
ncbi:hypothetical protein, partial [Pseudoalteromonas rubra]|uniref:hypothetical protein n=1 Tax=Pseudoalteromonas rubra TaxID=43658 RepID=UPI00197D1187